MTLGRDVHDDIALLIDICSIDSVWGKPGHPYEIEAQYLQAVDVYEQLIRGYCR